MELVRAEDQSLGEAKKKKERGRFRNKPRHRRPKRKKCQQQQFSPNSLTVREKAFVGANKETFFSSVNSRR